MALPKYLHAKGKYNELPDTLARRISFIRDERSIHINDLSKKARVSVEYIESLEAGLETWLAVAVRQRIARVLKVDPYILEEVEIKNESKDVEIEPSPEKIKNIKNEIMRGNKDLTCPLCNAPLRAWIQEGFDLLDNPTQSPKAHCTECTFQLKNWI